MCEYCEYDDLILYQNVSEELRLSVWAYDNTLKLGVANEDLRCVIDLKTNYCPMCGKKNEIQSEV